MKTARVKDLSATGVYLFTREHWPPNVPINLTFRVRGLGTNSPSWVTLPALVKRHCADGVGLAFKFDHIDLDTWREILEKAACMTSRIDQIRLFRNARVLAFIRRVAPQVENQVIEAFANEISCERAERAIELVLKTEDALEQRRSNIKGDPAPDLIFRILLESSKAEDELAQRFWRGLLVRTVEFGSFDSEAPLFAALLSQMVPLHLKLFAIACERAIESGWEANDESPERMACTIEEIRTIAGIKNLTVIERDLHHLHGLGLLEATTKPPAFQEIARANLTPTQLGMEFFVYCRS